MRYYLFTMLAVLLSTGGLQAQSLFTGGIPVKESHETSVPTAVEDTVAYYSDYVRMNGWIEGCGRKLTRDEARHRSSYLRFSKKNKAGHWTWVENYTGRRKPGNNLFETYLVRPSDSDDKNVNETWVEKLQSIVRLELIGDGTGRQCLQERAYDKKGSLVYSFILVPVSKNEVMGYYTDEYGEPSKMRDGEEEAEYVLIERDSRGFETKISFVGQNGFFRKNKDGAFMERNTYDDNGNRLSLVSCDVDGKYMIDRTGNCGQRLAYNSRGDLVSTTNINEKGEMMKDEEKGIDFYVRHSKFDRYGREIEGRYFLPNGEPDTLQCGVHGYRREYDNFGECVLYATFGLDGKPRNGNEGWAFLVRKYDEEGRESDREIRDQDGLLCRDDAGWHRKYKQGTDTLILMENYRSDDGVHKYVYDCYTRNGNIRERCNRKENYAWKERLDAQGNLLEDAYYDADRHPWHSMEDSIYHKMSYYSFTEGHTLHEETQILDTTNTLISVELSPTRSYNRKVVTFDSLTNLQTTIYYDGDKVLSIYVKQFANDGSNFVTSQHSLDITGKIARTWYSESLYYTAATGRNLKGEVTYVAMQNEYGEPAYVLTSDIYPQRGWSFNFSGNRYFFSDDKGKDRKATDIIREACKACIVEIVDSSANNYGLLSGDVIMKYGDWTYQKLSNKYYPDDELRLETFLKRNYPKEVVVMRHNLQLRCPEYLILQLPEGMPRNFGFTWHYFPYTDKEVERYEDTFSKYRQDLHIPDSIRFYGIDVDKGKIMWTTRNSHVEATSHEAYKKGMRNDAFVLGCMMLDANGEVHTYLATDTFSLYRECLKSHEIQRFRLWYTEDMNTICSVEFDDNSNLGLYSSPVSVPDSLSGFLFRMTQTVKEEMDSLIAPDCSSWSDEQKDSLYELAHGLWMKDADNRAHRIFSQLGAAGYSKAYYNLSADYLSGYGVEKDIKQAEQWEQLCRKDSSYTATYYIARKYVKDGNMKKAKEYLRYLRKGKELKKNEVQTEKYYYMILQYMSEVYPDKYGEKFSYYMADKAFCIKVSEGENQARTAGLAGTYFLLSCNGWNILSTENIYDETNKTDKDLILSDERNVNRYNFSGTVGFSLEMKVVGKEKKRQLEDAYRKYITEGHNQ